MHKNMSATLPRKRTRKLLLWTAMGAFLVPGVDALSSRTVPRTPSVESRTQAKPIMAPSSYSYESAVTPKVATRQEQDEEDFLEEEASAGLVQALQELQTSTTADVLQSDLQRQIDQFTSNPNAFLDQHGASAMEKLAMSSVTEQLPQAAVQAFSDRRVADADMQYSTKRVNREQEILLTRTIQKGASLQAVKLQAEAEEGRPLSRAEWARLAQVSTKDLRRQISLYRQAKQILVTANLGLVHAVVNQQWAQYAKSGVSKEELIQEGSLGLLRAAELFDPDRGLRFSTYAVVWIKGILQNTHVPELVRLPAREKTKWNKIVRAVRDLEESGRQGTLEEIASLTGLSVSDVLATKRRMPRIKAVLSLDYEQKTQSRSGAQGSTLNVLQNDKSMREDETLMERTQLQADVIAAMTRNLDAREARLMRLRYGLSDGMARSLAECADAMGLSRTRVQQISQRCLQKLREASEAESLQEYLLTIA
jgi:RNA polymerase sigma factor (sigma-70 family)